MRIIILALTLSINAFAAKDLRLGEFGAHTGVSRAIPAPLDIARGVYAGFSVVHKFGKNSDIDTGTLPEDVWHGQGPYTGFPTGAAETIECFSSDADDNASGTGARTIQLFPLDENFDVPTSNIILSLAGASAAVTAGTFKRLNRVKVLTAGSSGFNEGDITCRHSATTANVFAVMPATTSQTEIAAYTIPNNKTGYLRYLYVGLRDTKTTLSTGALWVRENNAATRNIRFFSTSHDTPYEYRPYGGIQLPEKTDFAVRILTTSANNTDINAHFDLLLIDND